MKDALSKVPTLRILIPFLFGIILASFYYIPSIYAIVLMTFSIIAFFLSNLIKNPVLILTKSYLFKSLPIILFVVCLGILCHNVNTIQNLSQEQLSCKYAEATILKINDNDFSTQLYLDVFNCIDSCGNTIPINQKMTAWIEENNYSLKEGDIIFFLFNPQHIKNNGNPEEMDYAKYMRHKGFLYHLYLNKEDYQKTGYNKNLYTIAKNVQRNLINYILASSLKPKAKTFFITILLGDSSLLQKETRAAFSYTGIAHILALSGLHMSIIALLLSIFLSPLDWMGHKKFRLIITVFLIILFSAIVGFPISVIRATTMISFVIIAKILRRENNSLNALFFSALLILLINPFAIYDIGFQFSFISVLLILLVSTRLKFINPKQELLYYFISLLVITITTSIGTMWLTAYYFNYISTFSILSNLIIIPILPLIIGFGLIYIILLSLGLDWNHLSQLLNGLYDMIISFSNEINNIPYSAIDNIYISTSILCICIVAIIFLVLYIHQKKIFYMYSLFIIILGAIFLNYINQYKKPTTGYVIFNEKEYTPILTFKNNEAILLTNEDSLDINSFKIKHRNFLSKYNINKLSSYPIPKQNYIFLGDKKVTIITDNKLKHAYLSPKINTDYLLITKGYYGTIQNLTNSYDFNTIILSGDIYHQRIPLLKDECDSLSIKCHVILEQGALYNFFN